MRLCGYVPPFLICILFSNFVPFRLLNQFPILSNFCSLFCSFLFSNRSLGSKQVPANPITNHRFYPGPVLFFYYNSAYIELLFVFSKYLNTPHNFATMVPSCYGWSNPNTVVLSFFTTDPSSQFVPTRRPSTSWKSWQLTTPLVHS
jgi:hypothetical protein